MTPMDLTATQGDVGRRLVPPAGVALSVCPLSGATDSSSAVRLPVVPPVRASPLGCPPANPEPPSMEGVTLLQRLGGILSMWTSHRSQSTLPLAATWQPSDQTVTPPSPVRNVGPRRAGHTHSPRRPRPEPTPTPPAAKCYRMASEDSDAEMPEFQPSMGDEIILETTPEPRIEHWAPQETPPPPYDDTECYEHVPEQSPICTHVATGIQQPLPPSPVREWDETAEPIHHGFEPARPPVTPQPEFD